MPHYKGQITDITEIESKQKGTPGLQIDLDLIYQFEGGEPLPINPPKKRSVWLYFPASGDNAQQAKEISLKKLAVCGWKGGPTHRSLIGNEVDVISSFEEYRGDKKEKFDIPLPAYKAERSENAAMVIDQLLASSQVPDVGHESEIDINEPARSLPDEGPDDEVPF